MGIAKLIVKKLNGKLSNKEKSDFRTWLNSSPKNKDIFERINLLHKSGKDISSLNSLNLDAAWNDVLRKFEENDNNIKGRIPSSLLKYAAIFIGFIGLALAYFLLNDKNIKNFVPINRDDNTITLQLENGEIHLLSSDGNQQLKDKNGKVYVTQQGTKLAYDQEADIQKLVYNTLRIPYGKRFEIKLSDGTSVHLNAGSTLKYPIKFIAGQRRQVFLTGEAYFDVSEDKKHPFVVSSSKLDVQVLGTKFNVAAYPEDPDITTVLVEGSVELVNTNVQLKFNPVKLEPGYKAIWDKQNAVVEQEVVDTDIYTGWISGKLVFKKIPFSKMLPKLERHFNVSIRNEYPELEREVFTATYDIENIEEVLNSLNVDTPFEFSKHNNEIIIQRP